jgi:hypothetical protein
MFGSSFILFSLLVIVLPRVVPIGLKYASLEPI